MSLFSWHKHSNSVRLDLETQSVCAGVGALMHAFEPACVEVSRLMRLPSKLHQHQNTPRRRKTDASDESVQPPRQSTGIQVAWHRHRQWIFTASLLLFSQSCFTPFPFAKPPYFLSKDNIIVHSVYDFCFPGISVFLFWESGTRRGRHSFVANVMQFN